MQFPVEGKIGDRWRAWGAADGAFGPPLGPEEDVPSRNGRRQRFERGEIAWSPDQDMTVSVYRLRNEACFEWSTSQFEYDYFRYDILYNGVGQGQASMQIRFSGGAPHIWTRLQGFGEYAFIVKGCTSPIIGPDECEQGFTVPVRVQFSRSAETPNPGGPNVSGLIEERWYELGAWSGPLGKPTGNEDFNPDGGIRNQEFENGRIFTAPAFGPRMVAAVYQRGRFIELNWGGADTAYDAFRVDVTHNGVKFLEKLVWAPEVGSEWARPGIGSGQVRLDARHGNGFYTFRIYPTIVGPSLTIPSLAPSLEPGVMVDPEGPPIGGLTHGDFPFGSTPEIPFTFVGGPVDADLVPPAMTGPPARAFASHIPRARAIARHYARTRPLYVTFDRFRPSKDRIEDEKGSSEDDAFTLIAHLEAVSENPDYRNPGELPSRILVAVALRQMVRGKVGTKKDYDMTLKGLMVIAYRYRKLLTEDDLDFIFRDVTPPDHFGGHSRALEVHKTIPVPVPDPRLYVIPETENHLLMIESTRYLVNQILFERTADEKYNNVRNGLTSWLLGF